MPTTTPLRPSSIVGSLWQRLPQDSPIPHWSRWQVVLKRLFSTTCQFSLEQRGQRRLNALAQLGQVQGERPAVCAVGQQV